MMAILKAAASNSWLALSPSPSRVACRRDSRLMQRYLSRDCPAANVKKASPSRQTRKNLRGLLRLSDLLRIDQETLEIETSSKSYFFFPVALPMGVRQSPGQA